MDIIREDCIYARQSVDRKDSISIESQIDFCKYELKGGSCKVFKDKEDCSTQEDIFNYPQNDKSEAAENPSSTKKRVLKKWCSSAYFCKISF